MQILDNNVVKKDIICNNICVVDSEAQDHEAMRPTVGFTQTCQSQKSESHSDYTAMSWNQ